MFYFCFLGGWMGAGKDGYRNFALWETGTGLPEANLDAVDLGVWDKKAGHRACASCGSCALHFRLMDG